MTLPTYEELFDHIKEVCDEWKNNNLTDREAMSLVDDWINND